MDVSGGIFIGTDIASQLPEEARRFDQIVKDYARDIIDGLVGDRLILKFSLNVEKLHMVLNKTR